MKKARIYTNEGVAKAQVTFWATQFPEYGCPMVVVLEAREKTIKPQEERVKGIKEKKIAAESKARVKNAKDDMIRARKQLREAEENYRSISELEV